MWGLSPLHLVVILLIILILVGPGKLPETGVAIGKALRGFKDALEGVDQPPAQAQPPVQPQPPVQAQQQYQPVAPAQPVTPAQAAPVVPQQEQPGQSQNTPPQ